MTVVVNAVLLDYLRRRRTKGTMRNKETRNQGCFLRGRTIRHCTPVTVFNHACDNGSIIYFNDLRNLWQKKAPPAKHPKCRHYRHARKPSGLCKGFRSCSSYNSLYTYYTIGVVATPHFQETITPTYTLYLFIRKINGGFSQREKTVATLVIVIYFFQYDLYLLFRSRI